MNNPLVFGNGSNGSFVTGIRFINQVSIAGSTAISGIVLDRCEFNSLYLAYGSVNGFTSSNHIVRNSYISTLYGFNSNNYSVVNSLITNNIIRYVTQFNQINVFTNNILTGYYTPSFDHVIMGVSYCNFHNNIVFNSVSIYCYSRFMYNSNSNIFSYNMFVGFNGGGGGTNNIFSNNLNSVDKDSIFVNYSPMPDTCANPHFVFSYYDDYQLMPNCVGIGAGNDGTDIGIYGGLTPWKEEAYPINPRIINFTVSPQVPANGIININATIEGQSR